MIKEFNFQLTIINHKYNFPIESFGHAKMNVCITPKARNCRVFQFNSKKNWAFGF